MRNSQKIYWLRIIGLLEGISFLVLLLIAMPIKYFLGNPLPVKYTGWMHGVLFMLYVLMVLLTAIALKWHYKRIILFLGASVVPLATFFLDASLKKEQLSQD